MAFSFQQKFDQAKSDRSIAVGSKNAVVQARVSLKEEDNFNDQFLHGDTNGNIGVNDLIWYWLYERSLESGNIYIRPMLDDSLVHWRYDYDSIMRASVNVTGDDLPEEEYWWPRQLPDWRYTNGFYPPNDYGVSSEQLNWATEFLNDNGDSKAQDDTWGYGIKGDSTGFLFHLYGLKTTVGSSPTNFPWSSGDSIVSGYDYATAPLASDAAKTYLYGDTAPPGTQVGTTMLGTGLIGRRRADADINTNQSGDWRYVIGDGDSDQPNFFGDSIGDTNLFLDDIAFKTNFTTKLKDVCLFGDSYSTYIAHLNSLAAELALIEAGTNTLFADPDMASEIGDSELNITSLVEELSRYIGDSTGDTWKPSDNGDSTLWGLYNYFTGGSPPDGTEANFDDALDLTKFLNDSVLSAVETRYDLLSDGTIMGSESETEEGFNGARKWRAFWVKARIGKPRSTLLSWIALANSVDSSGQSIDNKNQQLQIILGDTTWDHYQYISTPLILAAFYDPKLHQDTGVVLQKKITSVFDGQQHAEKYFMYRQEYTNEDSTSISNDKWGDTYYYDTITDLNDDTGFINTTYTDFGRVTYAGDSIQTGQELFLYEDVLFSYPDERVGDTVAGVSVEPTTFTYIDPIIGDSEEIINPRAKYWHGFDAGGASGLIAYYPLNGNARDYSGNSQHGVVTAAGTSGYETGYIEECFNFGGSPSRITISETPELDIIGDMSFSCWFNASSFGGMNPCLFSKGGGNTTQYWADIRDTGDRILWGGYSDVASVRYFSVNGLGFTTDTWYHVVGVREGLVLRLYINSVLVGSGNISGNAVNNSNDITIGARNGASQWWEGKIDEVRIYNRALTQTEITGIYNTRAMTTPWANVTGFWKGTTNVLNYPETIGDSGTMGDTFSGSWLMWTDVGGGDTVELTDYYFGDHRFSKITADNNDADLRQNIPAGTFGDTLGKSWSTIFKRGVGDTSTIYFINGSSSNQRGTYFIYWNTDTIETKNGDTSKTVVEWFTNDIVRISGTSNPLQDGDTGDSHIFIIEPQEGGTGTLYATATQVEESTYSTPYVNGSRIASSLAYDYMWGDSGTIEFTVHPRFDWGVDADRFIFGDYNDSSGNLAFQYQKNNDRFRFAVLNEAASVPVELHFAISDSGDSGDTIFESNTYLQQSHHFKIYWKYYGDSITYGDTKIFKLFHNGIFISGDSTGDSISNQNKLDIGGIPLFGTGYEFDGEITDFLIWSNGDTSSTHYLNGVPYFYADPFPVNTNYVYRTQTIDSLNKVNGDTTKSLQSNLFDSTNSTTWNAISGDSVLELGGEHEYKRNEYIVIDGTTSSNGYYKLTRTEDTSLFITPTLATGDVTGVVYPTTSVVFIEE